MKKYDKYMKNMAKIWRRDAIYLLYFCHIFVIYWLSGWDSRTETQIWQIYGKNMANIWRLESGAKIWQKHDKYMAKMWQIYGGSRLPGAAIHLPYFCDIFAIFVSQPWNPSPTTANIWQKYGKYNLEEGPPLGEERFAQKESPAIVLFSGSPGLKSCVSWGARKKQGASKLSQKPQKHVTNRVPLLWFLVWESTRRRSWHSACGSSRWCK